jgi:hypothetical protein
MSQVSSDGSQSRPWHAQSQWSQWSQEQLADADGGRRTLAGNVVVAWMGRSCSFASMMARASSQHRQAGHAMLTSAARGAPSHVDRAGTG